MTKAARAFCALWYAAFPLNAMAQSNQPATDAQEQALTASSNDQAVVAAAAAQAVTLSGRQVPPAAPEMVVHSGTPPFILHFEAENPAGKALRSLKTSGISLTANYVWNVAGNPVGGVKQGTVTSHWFDVGAELDLGKLIGLSHTRLHVQGADFEGDSLAVNDVGNSISFQQTWRPVAGWRLTQLNIDHDFGRLNLMVGRAALNSYYGASPFNCVFMSNTACLTGYGPIAAIGITAFPNSSWAGNVRWNLTKKAYVQAGVFDYNNTLNVAGAAGVDFSLFKGTGKLIATEVGYETTFANDRYPRRYRLGVDINTDPGTSPLYDKNGNSSALSGLARAQQTGTRVGIYGVADQTLLRPDSRSQRNTAVFARFFYNAGAPTTIDWFASVGLVKTGTFKGRDNDTLDFLISNTHFDAKEIIYLGELRAKAGGAGYPYANEIIGELNYGFAAAPGVRIMPNVQWDIHPVPINATKFQRDIPSAVVVGLRIDIRFAQLLMGSSPVEYRNSKVY